ncbi:NAD(P)/FAD-dependent oxidoreductase [Planctomycetales bacterium ZRK34]|nr:NAD(P)/FAD-dependent oxidoreductase [Planctomycetales bacterium ZRK34]
MSPQQPKTIVIIGGGFAGAYCAHMLLRRSRPDEIRVRLINQTNYFAFTPLLIEAGTGALEPRHAVVPLRRFAPGAELHMGTANGIDFEARRVTYRTMLGETYDLEYDHVVLAPGSVTQLPDVPGLRDHGYSIKSIGEAIALRDRAIAMLEQAEDCPDADRRRAMLTFVIVGANYTGVEVAGEFNDLLRRATRDYRNIQPDDIRVVLVDHEDRILNTLDESLSDYAMKQLRRRGVEIHLKDTATQIHAESVELKQAGRIDTMTLIWTAGIAPSPLIDALDVPCDQRGYVLCEPDLRIQGHDHAWAIGDSAVNVDPEGHAYPPTAQHAVREGQQAGRNILRVLRGSEPEPLVYRSQGMIAPLGDRDGVAGLMGLRLSGLPAWFLWRTVYLLKMPGIGRSLRVMLDWTLDWFFRRDYVQLGIHNRPHSHVDAAADDHEKKGPDA